MIILRALAFYTLFLFLPSLIILSVLEHHFTVRDIHITGYIHSDPGHISEVLGARRGDALFARPLEEMKGNLERLDWVREARIWRLATGVLAVSIREHQPVALWHHEGQTMVVAKDGTTLKVNGKRGFLSNLPVIRGERAPEALTELFNMALRWPALQKAITGASLSKGKRWTVHLRNGSEIHLPGENIPTAIERLQWLNNRFHFLTSSRLIIDMRAPDRVAVREKSKGNIRNLFVEEHRS